MEEIVKLKLDNIDQQLQVIENKQNIIYHTQKRQNLFYLLIAIIFTAVFSFIVSSSIFYKTIAVIVFILMLIFILIINYGSKIREREFRKRWVKNWKEMGLSDEEIRNILSRSINFF